ncbi:MAG: MBL fold metallo-hydrolase [Bacilli bacterium]
MKVTYYGQSVVSIVTEQTKICIDPIVRGNSMYTLSHTEQEADYIVLTHTNKEAVGDVLNYVAHTKAIVIAPKEMSTLLSWHGVKTHNLEAGNSYRFPFGTVHFASEITDNGVAKNGAGMFIEMEGYTLYHSGVDVQFSKNKVLHPSLCADVAFIPLKSAIQSDADSNEEWSHAKTVIPMYYHSFGMLNEDMQKFREQFPEGKVLHLTPGQHCTLPFDKESE